MMYVSFYPFTYPFSLTKPDTPSAREGNTYPEPECAPKFLFVPFMWHGGRLGEIITKHAAYLQCILDPFPPTSQQKTRTRTHLRSSKLITVSKSFLVLPKKSISEQGSLLVSMCLFTHSILPFSHQARYAPSPEGNTYLEYAPQFLFVLFI